LPVFSTKWLNGVEGGIFNPRRPLFLTASEISLSLNLLGMLKGTSITFSVVTNMNDWKMKIAKEKSVHHTINNHL